eukprot:jgi/Orpsp1_1/1176629/evm.model.c7180000058378.1
MRKMCFTNLRDSRKDISSSDLRTLYENAWQEAKSQFKIDVRRLKILSTNRLYYLSEEGIDVAAKKGFLLIDVIKNLKKCGCLKSINKQDKDENGYKLE